MQFRCSFDPAKEIVVLVVACNPDTRHPDRAARKYIRAATGAKVARNINGAPSPELTILDQEDQRGLDGLVYNIRQVIGLHPNAQVLVAVFGHEDCKRNPQTAAVQKGQIFAACEVLHARIWSDGMGDFTGVMDVAGFYQPVSGDNKALLAEDTVCVTSTLGIHDFGSAGGAA